MSSKVSGHKTVSNCRIDRDGKGLEEVIAGGKGIGGYKGASRVEGVQ